MNIPAWHIVGWPAVDLSIEQWTGLSGFQLVGHSSRLDEEGRRSGSTLWAAKAAAGRVGLAWEWCELQSNVVVMSDPMSIMSNVVLRDEERKTNEFERILHLNNAVYQLPWQKRLAFVIQARDDEEVALPLAA